MSRISILSRLKILACLLPLAWARPGHAATEYPQFPETPAPANEAVAYLWMAGATVLPMAAGVYMGSKHGWEAVGTGMFLAGVFVGPSAGQFYAGSDGHALGAAGIRTGGLFLGILALANTCMDCSGGGDGSAVLGAASVMMLGGGMLFSLIDTHFAVKRNREAITGMRAGLDPILDVTPEGWVASAGARAWLHF